MVGSLGYWATFVLVGKAAAQDFSNVGQYSSSGCYSSIPSSFTSQGSSSSNSGLSCYTKCKDAGFQVMALKSLECYCGNELPAGSAEGNCDVSCPGFSSDQCGGSNAFNIYVKNGANVSPASEGESSSSSATSSASSSASSTSTSDSSSDSTSSTSASSSTSDSSSATTTQESSQESSQGTTTVSGSVVVSTVTATQSSPSTATHSDASAEEGTSSSSSSSSSSSIPDATAEAKNSGLSGGAIAGIVVGVVAGLAAIAAILFFLWRRRKEEFYSPNSSPHKFETSFNSGYNQEYPSIVDQRLNPQLLNHRISIASLADARDYSRQILKVANPDDKE